MKTRGHQVALELVDAASVQASPASIQVVQGRGRPAQPAQALLPEIR